MTELPPYPDYTILVTEVGSTAHGTGLPGKEDHDETVVFIERPSGVFALRDHEPWAKSVRTQPEGVPSGPGDTDRNIYSLRRFLSLASSGNPSIMLVLWAPVIEASSLGFDLRSHGLWFVGRHLIPRYRGYMRAQVDRLLGLRGGRHGRFRDDAAGYDTKYAMHAARLGYQGIELLTTGGLKLPIEGETGRWLQAVRRGEVTQAEWQERIDDLEAQLTDLEGDEGIPPGPDRQSIVNWSYAAHMKAWGR